MDHDQQDVAKRWKDGLTRSAARAYQAAHGNPIPDTRKGSRWAMEPRVAITLALIAAVGGLVVFWSVRPAPVAQVTAPVVSTSEAGQAEVLIHVAGAVQTPGLVTLSTGARVADAVEASGGLRDDADASAINLARVVGDGEQIYVPAVGESASGGKVNLNRASATELEELPGIGPVLAQRIVDDRDTHGAFASVEDLERVSGVGASILANLADLATV